VLRVCAVCVCAFMHVSIDVYPVDLSVSAYSTPSADPTTDFMTSDHNIRVIYNTHEPTVTTLHYLIINPHNINEPLSNTRSELTILAK
jgi:hypothetical protein